MMDTIDEMKRVLRCMKHICKNTKTCEYCLMSSFICPKGILMCPEAWTDDLIEGLTMKEE